MINSIKKWFKREDDTAGEAAISQERVEEFAKALADINKEKPAFVPVVLTVPDGEVLDVLRLIDEVDKHNTRVSRYQLWVKVQSIFPETKEGKWKLNSWDATSLKIISTPG